MSFNLSPQCLNLWLRFSAAAHMCFHARRQFLLLQQTAFPKTRPSNGSCHPASRTATRLLGILSATYSRGGRSSQNWHNQIKPVFVTGKRMSGGQDCQYWGRLHFIECLLRSCASKPEQLFLLLHSLSHSGSRFQKVGARASGAGEDGIMSSRVNTSGANKAGVDWKGGSGKQ